ncbi:MAG: Rrf2 family transcriptional regulator [Gammaproteobacteria bacterium]|nr:Rrf2 family transcriptional regulator [Gammaproteobacteria bacterium]
MKIPTKGRYAVSAMMDLAIHDKIKPLTIAEIAEKQNISLSYLEQLFAVLRRNNLVRGTRGPGGGYRLAQPAGSITIAQIIRSVDASVADQSEAGDEYLPYVLWEELSCKMYEFLDGITLSACVERTEVSQGVDAEVQAQIQPGDEEAAA